MLTHHLWFLTLVSGDDVQIQFASVHGVGKRHPVLCFRLALLMVVGVLSTSGWFGVLTVL